MEIQTNEPIQILRLEFGNEVFDNSSANFSETQLNPTEYNWEFIYESGKSLNVYGGDIVSKNNIVFFYLPNGRLGKIDTVIGENVDSLFSKIKYNHNI